MTAEIRLEILKLVMEHHDGMNVAEQLEAARRCLAFVAGEDGNDDATTT